MKTITVTRGPLTKAISVLDLTQARARCRLTQSAKSNGAAYLAGLGRFTREQLDELLDELRDTRAAA